RPRRACSASGRTSPATPCRRPSTAGCRCPPWPAGAAPARRRSGAARPGRGASRPRRSWRRGSRAGVGSAGALSSPWSPSFGPSPVPDAVQRLAAPQVESAVRYRHRRRRLVVDLVLRQLLEAVGRGDDGALAGAAEEIDPAVRSDRRGLVVAGQPFAPLQLTRFGVEAHGEAGVGRPEQQAAVRPRAGRVGRAFVLPPEDRLLLQLPGAAELQCEHRLALAAGGVDHVAAERRPGDDAVALDALEEPELLAG